ncbi:MAG: TOBE domain-containing protein [Anaerolineales bacterium]
MDERFFVSGTIRANGIDTELGFIPQIVSLEEGSTVEVALRAEDVSFELEPGSDCMVLGRQLRGEMNIFRLRLSSGRLLHALEGDTNNARPGMPVRIRLDPGHPLAVFYRERRFLPHRREYGSRVTRVGHVHWMRLIQRPRVQIGFLVFVSYC